LGVAGARAGRGIAPGTRLVLVRHGEAHCNVEGYVAGPTTCRGLTELGRRQLAELARRFSSTGELGELAALYTSELPRAFESAELLCEAAGAVPQRRRELGEREPGIADGLSWAEVARRFGRETTPGDQPERPIAPGGESWAGFVDRACAALVSLATAHAGESVLVVTHGGVIDASLIGFLGLAEHGAAVRLHPENASITEWRHTGRRWRLVRYNDAAHLDLATGEIRSSAPEWVFLER
jgi:2,3-bisphosphoglycerate-dependent phosphoglycerate mutase